MPFFSRCAISSMRSFSISLDISLIMAVLEIFWLTSGRLRMFLAL